MRGTGGHSRQQVNARMPGGKNPGSVCGLLQARRFSGHGHCERGAATDDQRRRTEDPTCSKAEKDT